MGAEGAAGWFMLLKNGFFDSSGGLMTVAGTGGGAGALGGAGTASTGGAGDTSLGSSWLAAGVLSMGVMV